MTRVLQSPFITTVWTPVVLSQYLGHVKNVNDDDDAAARKGSIAADTTVCVCVCV